VSVTSQRNRRSSSTLGALVTVQTESIRPARSASALVSGPLAMAESPRDGPSAPTSHSSLLEVRCDEGQLGSVADDRGHEEHGHTNEDAPHRDTPEVHAATLRRTVDARQARSNNRTAQVHRSLAPLVPTPCESLSRGSIAQPNEAGRPSRAPAGVARETSDDDSVPGHVTSMRTCSFPAPKGQRCGDCRLAATAEPTVYVDADGDVGEPRRPVPARRL
jgi:hypothetical protein